MTVVLKTPVPALREVCMTPEPVVYVCALCRADAPALRYVDATMLAIPVRDFCEACARDVEEELRKLKERTR